MKIEIKSRWHDKVIFAHEAEENNMRITVEAAIAANLNLKSADLMGANLMGAYLKSANLEYADLMGANLKYANLESANLKGANLESANLKGANLEYANLEYANLKGANLEYANLMGADLEGANLESANLKGANLEYANLMGADLEGANLKGASIDFSFGWQFHCRHSRFRIGLDFAYQVLAHLCSCESEESEFKEIREKMLPYALKSHWALDLGLIDGGRDKECGNIAGEAVCVEV